MWTEDRIPQVFTIARLVDGRGAVAGDQFERV